MCLDDNIDARACKLRCGHHLCNNCIVKLERPLCPTCRAPMFPLPANVPPPPDMRNTREMDPDYFRDPSLMDRDILPPAGNAMRAMALPIHELPRSLQTSYEMQPLLQGNPDHFQRQHSQLRYARYSPTNYD